MIHLNEPTRHPDWSYPNRCQCDCLCATNANWAGHARRYCGCCPTGCANCAHDQPLTWQGDNT